MMDPAEINAVECTSCKTLHRKDADTYWSVYGNLCEGAEGGIIGNNFDEKGKLKRISIFCKGVVMGLNGIIERDCLVDILKKILE